MNKIRIAALVFVALVLLNSCIRKKETEKPDKTSETDAVTETLKDTKKDSKKTETKEETDAAETTKETPETTAEPEEASDNHVTEITLDKYEVKIAVGETDMPMVTMKPDTADKTEIWSSSDVNTATVNQYGRITGVKEGNCTVKVTSADNKKISAEVKVTVTAAKEEPGLSYINGILIANKSYALPSTYNPGVDPTAQSALNEMISAASKEGISLWVVSGFRSYNTQKTLYNNYVARDGKAAADTYSARPGYSEHQTGLAFDLNSVEQSFGETKEGKWLAANCYKYGFIIRYPQNKETQTGYMYEPWHVRYLGKDTAAKVYNSGLCLEEYLGIKSVYAN